MLVFCFTTCCIYIVFSVSTVVFCTLNALSRLLDNNVSSLGLQHNQMLTGQVKNPSLNSTFSSHPSCSPSNMPTHTNLPDGYTRIQIQGVCPQNFRSDHSPLQTSKGGNNDQYSSSRESFIVRDNSNLSYHGGSMTSDDRNFHKEANRCVRCVWV